ncbi:hypothetical protein DL95DRAFT_471952 [Leptodontidium sp. 2 PMI_412]|nr:hypothetical protein DL95DRAFT_471952 [Leptodontidium sp. 2 PMI_412]
MPLIKPSLNSVRLTFPPISPPRGSRPVFLSTHFVSHTFHLTHHTDANSTHTGVGILDLNKTAARALYTKMFTCTDNFNITTRAVNGHKNFTSWEWEATFNYVKLMEELAHEEVFGPAMADGRSMRMLGVNLLWWNDDGKIVKDHSYTKTLSN